MKMPKDAEPESALLIIRRASSAPYDVLRGQSRGPHNERRRNRDHYDEPEKDRAESPEMGQYGDGGRDKHQRHEFNEEVGGLLDLIDPYYAEIEREEQQQQPVYAWRYRQRNEKTQ